MFEQYFLQLCVADQWCSNSSDYHLEHMTSSDTAGLTKITSDSNHISGHKSMHVVCKQSLELHYAGADLVKSRCDNVIE